MELRNNRLQWAGGQLTSEVRYRPHVPCGCVHLNRYPGSTETQQTGIQTLVLSRQHGCACWLLDMRHVNELARPTTRRSLVSALLKIGEQLYSTYGPLHMAVSVSQVPLAE